VDQFILVQTTVAQKEDAERIAKAVTMERLSACAQVEGPITSLYWWKGTLETAVEWKCTFKTANRLFDQIANRIKTIHPYETPEIIAIPILNGSAEYLTWLEEELQK
jgi:periplasmic divalent cation tolerance protein